MPWGDMSSLCDMPHTKSNDGPILWMRPGEQSIPTAELGKSPLKRKRHVEILQATGKIEHFFTSPFMIPEMRASTNCRTSSTSPGLVPSGRSISKTALMPMQTMSALDWIVRRPRLWVSASRWQEYSVPLRMSSFLCALGFTHRRFKGNSLWRERQWNQPHHKRHGHLQCCRFPQLGGKVTARPPWASSFSGTNDVCALNVKNWPNAASRIAAHFNATSINKRLRDRLWLGMISHVLLWDSR